MASQSGERRQRVLVVDDDEMILALARHALSNAGLDVDTSAAATGVLEDSGADSPACVVTDVDLPDIDGFEFARRFRAARPRHVPFVFLTMRGAPADVLANVRRDGDDFLAKPFGVEELVARVQAQLASPRAAADDATVVGAATAAAAAVAAPAVVPVSAVGSPVSGNRRLKPLALLAAVLVATAAAGVALGAVAFGGGRDTPTAAPVRPTSRSTPAASSTRPSAASAPSASSGQTPRPSPPSTPLPTLPLTLSPAPGHPGAGATARTSNGVPCNDPVRRGRAALRLVRHPSWLRGVPLRFSRGRRGVLAADPDGRRVVVYVRSCTAEPLSEVAAAAIDQIAKFRAVRWTSATQGQWQQVRGVDADNLQQDVGAVAILWQLGTTAWWRSPVPPPNGVPRQLVSLLAR